MNIKYKSIIVAGALLAAPLAFAQQQNENQGGPDMPPPPQGGMMQGQMHMIGEASSSAHMPAHGPMMPPGMHMGTSTDGMQKGEMHGGMMGSSTMDHGMPPQMGTSTSPRGGIGGFFSGMFSFFAGKHDDASSTPGDMPQPHDGMMASTSMDANASSTLPTPPQGIAGFLAHIFSFLHH